MSFYLDTNAIYSFVFADAHSQRIDTWIARRRAPIVVGDWVKIELYTLVWRRIRGGQMTADAGAIGMSDFEAFVRVSTRALPLSNGAGSLAETLARDPLLKLSAADALHLALSAHGGHSLVTFDARLADATRARGYPVEIP